MFHPGQTSSCFCPELCNLLILLWRFQALNSQSFGGKIRAIIGPFVKFQWIFTMPHDAVLKSSHPVLRRSQPPAGEPDLLTMGHWDNGRSQRLRPSKAIPTAPSATSAPAMVCRSPAFREGGNVESVAAKETMSFTGYSRVSNVGTSLFIIDDHHFWWLKHSEACWASVLAQFYQMSCWILTCRQNQWSA